MIASEDDQNIDSVGVCRLAKETMDRVAKKNNKILTFLNIGHLVGRSNTPSTKYSNYPVFPMDSFRLWT